MFSLNLNMLLIKLMNMNLGIFSKIGDMIKDFFTAIFDFLQEVIRVSIDYLVKPIYVVFLGVCKLLDLFEIIVKKLAGMDVVYINGSAVTGDLTLSLLNNNNIWKAFTAMLALGSLMLFVTTFIAVVRSQMSMGPKANVKFVIRNFIMSLINFAIVPILCFAGIYFGNQLLKALDAATNQTGANTVSAAIFIAAGYDANRGRDPSSYMYENYLSPSADNSDGYNTANGMFRDSGSNGTAATAIDNAFGQQITVENCKFAFITLHKILLGNPFAGTASTFLAGGWTAFLPTDEEIESGWLESIFYTRTSGTITFSIYNTSLVCLYYNLVSFNYIIGIGAGILLLKCYLDLIFGLIKRLYMLVTLFIISPPIIALYPLDDGRALGGWKQQFIGNAISAYAAVVCMNIYLMLMAVFQQVTLFAEPVSSVASASEITYVEAELLGMDAIKNNPVTKALANLGITLANELCQTIIIIAGAMFFREIVGTVSRIIGANDAMAEGAATANKMKQAVKDTVKKTVEVGATIAGAVATGGAALGAKGAATAAKGAAAAQRMSSMKALAGEGAKAVGGAGGGAGGGMPEGGAAEGGAPESAPEGGAPEGGVAEESGNAAAGGSNGGSAGGAENIEPAVKQDQATSEPVTPAETSSSGKAPGGLGKVWSAVKRATPKGKQNAELQRLREKALANGATPEQIAAIDQKYNEEVRAADAYNPIKNPIQARIRSMKQNFRDKYMYRGVTGEERAKLNESFKENDGRRAAIRAKTAEYRDDLKAAKATGDPKLIASATKRMNDYMKAVNNGLQRNEKYWSQQASLQKSISTNNEKLQELQNELQAKMQRNASAEELARVKADIASMSTQVSSTRQMMENAFYDTMK